MADGGTPATQPSPSGTTCGNPIPPVQPPTPPTQPDVPPVQPGPMPQLNWYHFKPEFAGKNR